MTEQEQRNAIQIANLKSINGKQLEMVVEEKNGEVVLYGEDSNGHRYTLDVITVPMEERT